MIVGAIPKQLSFIQWKTLRDVQTSDKKPQLGSKLPYYWGGFSCILDGGGGALAGNCDGG